MAYDSSTYVKSFSYDQHEILKWILKLHCKTEIELDPTYGRGCFYKNGVNKPKYCFDLISRKPGVVQADCRCLPLKDGCVDTMIFDPPFLATKGKSLKVGAGKRESNLTVKRFGCYETEEKLFQFYKDSLIEFKRALKKSGILIFKCQDKVSSGKQYVSHNRIINQAEGAGFYTKDIFILLAKARMIPEWQTVNQKHARKFHSYFLVFQRP
jgi:hypothetical protein